MDLEQTAQITERPDILLLLLPCDPYDDFIRTVKDDHPGISVRWFNVAAPGGGLFSCDDVPTEVWEGVTMLCTYLLPRPELVPCLQFVQLTSAGSDQCVGNGIFEDPNIIFCSANGIHP